MAPNDSDGTDSPPDSAVRYRALAANRIPDFPDCLRHTASSGATVMGEMAEYMLNGDDCEMCGIYLAPEKYGPADGYPRYCSKQCADDRGGYWQGYSKEYKEKRKQRRAKS